MIKCALCNYIDNNDNFPKFALHLRYKHKITKTSEFNIRDYYIKYILQDKNEIYCKYCKINQCNLINLKLGLCKYCSRTCTRKATHQQIAEEVKTGKRQYNFATQETKEKIKNTLKLRYGVEHSSQIPGIYEKRNLTHIERTGFSIAEDPNRIQKMKNTWIEHYGTDNIYNVKEIKEKREQTLLQNYGVKNPFSSNIIKEKIKQTNVKRYGVENVFASDVIKEKIYENNIKKYGVKFITQTAEFQNKIHFKYKFENINFDSSWELAYYIWLKDNNIVFEYQPNISFKYIVNNIEHYYYPDFLVNNKYIEIKGDQFLTENGMICPWDETKNDIYNEKYQCMIDNNVKILREKDIIPILDYIEIKYGKNYLKQFKTI